MVKYASMTHEEFFNEQMKDPEFAKAYEESEEEFKALQKAIELRMQQKLSQTEVAQRMNYPLRCLSLRSWSFERHTSFAWNA